MKYKIDYFGYVYQWTNKINNMKYIGSHYGNVLDSYTGSGKQFKPAYEKNPENFYMEVLEYLTVDCKKTLLKLEQKYLDSVNSIRENKEYYNLNNFSLGGSSHITQEHVNKRSATLREKHKKYGLSESERNSYKQKIQSRLNRIANTGFTEAEENQHNSYGYEVKITTPNGEVKIYPSCAKASKDLDIDVQYARKVCLTKDNFKGYKVETLEMPKIDCRGLND